MVWLFSCSVGRLEGIVGRGGLLSGLVLGVLVLESVSRCLV